MVNELDSIDLRVLDLLEGRNLPRSGQEMAEALGLSRVALWKRIERLKRLGFEIAAAKRGYVLRGEDSIALGLAEALPDFVYVPSSTSTMDEAARLADEGAPSGTIVMADEQSAGRGRLSREWRSPHGGLYLSVLVRPRLPATYCGALVLEALSIAATCSGRELEAVWPNDLFLEGRKVGGLLVESRGQAERPAWYVVGLGLNLEPVSVPGRQSGYLRQGVPRPRRRDIAREFRKRLGAWCESPDCRAERWGSALRAGATRRVRVKDWRGGERVGSVTGYSPRGGLLLDGEELNMAETAKVSAVQ